MSRPYKQTLSFTPFCECAVVCRKPGETICEIGPRHVILSSYLGQAATAVRTAALLAYFANLKEQGFTQSEIDPAAKVNPARFLGLE